MEVKPKCPVCEWSPNPGKHWNCLECGVDMDHFDNVARCSNCGYTHELTYCPEHLGGCGQSSAHMDWYGNFDRKLREIDIFNL